MDLKSNDQFMPLPKIFQTVQEDMDKIAEDFIFLGKTFINYILAKIIISKIKTGLKNHNEEKKEEVKVSKHIMDMVTDPEFVSDIKSLMSSFKKFEKACAKYIDVPWEDSKQEVLHVIDTLLIDTPLLRTLSQELGDNTLALLFNRVRENSDVEEYQDITTKEYLGKIGKALELEFPGYQEKLTKDLEDFTTILLSCSKEALGGKKNVSK